jgi:hypothetical protein
MPEIAKLIRTLKRLGEGISLKPGKYQVVAKTWEVLACACVPGATFAFDKSFIRPSIADSLKGLSDSLNEHPQCKVLVFGHTDKVGDEGYNQKLSERRAKSAFAFITNDVDSWENLYNEEKWGLEAIQEMLADLGCYDGPIDGKDGPRTQEGIKVFQESWDIEPTGKADKATRKLLFREYMTGKHDILIGPEQFLDPRYVGCGEFNPKVDTEDECEENRRVSFFLFHPDRLPKIPCKQGDIAPCKKMINLEGARQKKSFKCAFYDNIGRDCACDGGGGKPNSLFIKNLAWEKTEAACGDKVKITADTLLNEGTEVQIDLKTQQGNSATLKPIPAKVTGGRIEAEWQVADVSFLSGGKSIGNVQVKASIDAKGETAENTAPIVILAYSDAEAQTYTSNKKWGKYSNHAEFSQMIKGFRNFVRVDLKAVKAWGGTYVDMSSKLSGKAGGCPWDGHRWGRGTGVNAMLPNEYYDGNVWKPFPSGFKLKPDLYGTVAFYKSGSQFLLAGGGSGSWPEAFADYDFDDPKYVKRRQEWIDCTHDTWTGVFAIRRKDCPSQKTNGCCRYGLEVALIFAIQPAWSNGVTCICPGDLRSNTATWFMGDSRIEVAAHETGHHMDNPDEYKNGAVDTSLNGDGAVNGIDPDCIMGQKLTQVKKRHYHAFVEMNKRLIKQAYGKDYEYEVVDK